MTEALRIAVVGVGRMGAFHARTLAKASTLDVVAVADAAPGVAAGVAGDLGIVGFESTDALLERDDVEAWVVATPTPTHGGLTGSALEAGLHVLCEKPLSLDPVESDVLGAQAATLERVLQVGFWRRFAPPWVRAREVLDAGRIGRPLMIRLAQWDADPPPAEFCDPTISGGLAIDCGVHEYDLAEWLSGLAVERVTARNLPLVDEALGTAGDVDNLVAVLDLAGGAVAIVDLSRNARYGDDVRTEILGAEGAVFVDLFPTARTRLATGDGIAVVPGSEAADAVAAGIVGQAEAFAARIRGRFGDVPGAAVSTRALQIGRAVQESAATGAPIPIGP
jgi:predicted dehydrogenase